MANKWGIKISKDGIDARKADPRDLVFSTQYDTMKVNTTGTLSIALPQETLNLAGTVTSEHTTSYTHDLGYIPMFLPLFGGVGYATVTRDVDSTETFVINDSEEWEIPPGSYSPNDYGEVATIFVTSSVITLKIYRYNFLPFDQVFGAHTAEAYYTIFHNKMSEEFNLL